MAAPSPTTALPSRTLTIASEDAVPDADPSTTAGLLAERLQAYKHMVGYMEEYMTAVEKIHGRQAKEYEKVLKTISQPLREAHHFDQNLGGITGWFENVRHNTQVIINSNIETEKSLKGSVLPILDRLHKEIKHKAKELASGAQHGAKEVEKLRNLTQKHIELLAAHVATFGAHGASKPSGADDPYVLRRGVLHRLSNQVIAENNHRNDLVAVQDNLHIFESHILQVLQSAMEAFVQLAGGQGERLRAAYADMLGTLQCVPHDFEWTNFSSRYADRLVNPNDPPRSVQALTFPNMDHGSTKALIEGSLERKSRNKLSFGFSTAYYVVTPSKYLHAFKDSDDVRQDPKPELSIYLPDAVIGTPVGEKFSVKGIDKSGTLSSKLTGSSELSFKAHTAADAQNWFSVIYGLTAAGSTHAAVASPTSPTAAGAPPAVVPPAAGAVTHDEKAAAAAVTTPVSPTAGGHQAQEAGVTGVTKPSGDEKSPAP